MPADDQNDLGTGWSVEHYGFAQQQASPAPDRRGRVRLSVGAAVLALVGLVSGGSALAAAVSHPGTAMATEHHHGDHGERR